MIYRIRSTEIFTLTHITYIVISNYHKNIHMHSQSGNTGDWERWLPRKQPTDSLYTVLDHEYCKELNESQASSRLEWITLHQRLRIGFRTITTEKGQNIICVIRRHYVLIPIEWVENSLNDSYAWVPSADARIWSRNWHHQCFSLLCPSGSYYEWMDKS